MIIGGMTLNTCFMKENLINEVWLSIYPLFIGKGKPLTHELDIFKNPEFIGSKKLAKGLIQLRYKANKSWEK